MLTIDHDVYCRDLDDLIPSCPWLIARVGRYGHNEPIVSPHYTDWGSPSKEVHARTILNILSDAHQTDRMKYLARFESVRYGGEYITVLCILPHNARIREWGRGYKSYDGAIAYLKSVLQTISQIDDGDVYGWHDPEAGEACGGYIGMDHILSDLRESYPKGTPINILGEVTAL